MSTPKITLHMVASLDGFIAKKDGDVSWMHSEDHYDAGVTLSEEYIASFLQQIDCYIMGSRTYEHALELGWPYGNTPVIVLTSRPLADERETVAFYQGELQDLISERLVPPYTNCWVVGGALLTKAFLRQQLVDEIVLTIAPVLLGGGLLFFDYIGREIALQLKDSTAYQNGMVELTYGVKRDQ